MAFETMEVYPNKRSKIDGQRAFVLAFPYAVVYKTVGNILIELEKNNLKVEDMRLMGVRRKFAERHFSKPGRIPTHFKYPCVDWVGCTTTKPVVAFILRGDDAVNKACKIVSDEREATFWAGGRINFYSSDSAENAEDDIKTWFDDYCGDWSQTDLFHAFADGSWQGVKDIFNGSVEALRPYGIDPDLKDNMRFSKHVLVLISSDAVRNYKVGEIIHGLERNCFSIRGMKLVVKKGKVTDSKIWAEIGEDEFGIVLLLDMLHREKIEESDEVNGLVQFDIETDRMLLKRNLVYISTPGDEAWQLAGDFFPFGAVSWMERKEAWQLAGDFFPFGAVSWVERKNEEVKFFGGYFESTLIGLIE